MLPLLVPQSEVFDLNFVTPQSVLRKLLKIDPSRPNFIAFLDTLMFTRSFTIVNDYQKLYDSGVVDILWPEDIAPGTISIFEVNTFADYERFEKIKQIDSNDLTLGVAIDNVKMVFYRMEEFSKIITPEITLLNGDEPVYVPEKYGSWLTSRFTTLNWEPFKVLRKAAATQSIQKNILTKDTYQDAIAMSISTLVCRANRVGLLSLLSQCPDTSFTFEQSVQYLKHFDFLAQEYNEEWAAAICSWDDITNDQRDTARLSI